MGKNGRGVAIGTKMKTQHSGLGRNLISGLELK